jgi:cardiolipin synthase
VKLIIQPEEGIAPLLAAIKNAKERVDIAIFRFDRADLEKELKAAVGRGVKVNALIAYASRGGEKSLRSLETRFLGLGMTVCRTDSDLIRYHDKVLVVDQKVLHVLSFNFTHQDIDHSRGFGIVTEHAKLVAEGLKLLEADCARTEYASGDDSFVVSPVNARKVLGKFLKRARKQLLIYDPKISDKEMIRILKEQAKSGVEIRVIGETDAPLTVRKLGKLRLHTRTILRDGKQAFIGSQSLRSAELDSRREVGLIVKDAKIVKKLMDTFEADWAASAGEESEETIPAADGQATKAETEKAIKVLLHELHPVAATLKKAVNKVVAQAGDEVLKEGIVKETVKKVVKKVVKLAVKDAVSQHA